MWNSVEQFQVLPWYEHPFRLISWLDMLQHSAKAFCQVSSSLRAFIEIAARHQEDHKGKAFTAEGLRDLFLILDHTRKHCETIGLRESAKCAHRVLNRIKSDTSISTIHQALNEIHDLFISELEGHLFLWVPSHRADWYGKKAEDIVGRKCCRRFPSIKREVEEAAKCYALGRYTAAGFHLTRSAEAGVQALAKAIHFRPKHNQWTLVFQRMEEEYKIAPAQRKKHWKTHGKFLTKIWADLDIAAKVWRNDLAHLVATYTEDEAKDLFDILPKLLRDLADRMDEKGKLYRS